MPQARLIVDEKLDGFWNMAVDHALLESANQTGQITLRFYRWIQPTLTLGYFQPARQRIEHRASLQCQMTRRSTGGGAIVHDDELTYSLCIPNANRWAKANEETYFLIHRSIVDVLKGGKQTSALHDPDLHPGGKTDAFLCFLRRSRGDVLMGEHKVCGSAQRRKKNALIQHGSILLSRSKFAPELPGICDLIAGDRIRDTGVLDSQLSASIVDAVENGLGVDFDVGELTSEEIQAAEKANSQFYTVDGWINRR